MQRLAICNRRVATHSCMLTRQLGCRASAGRCRLLARVTPRATFGSFARSTEVLNFSPRSAQHIPPGGFPRHRNPHRNPKCLRPTHHECEYICISKTTSSSNRLEQVRQHSVHAPSPFLPLFARSTHPSLAATF